MPLSRRERPRVTRRYLPFAKRKGTRASEARSQGMPLSRRERPRVTRRYLPFAKRKGTRASEARSQGMPLSRRERPQGDEAVPPLREAQGDANKRSEIAGDARPDNLRHPPSIKSPSSRNISHMTQKYRILKQRARQMRNAPTDAERILWYGLRKRRLDGYPFLRQRVIDGMIVDFVCRKTKLVIEVDGGQHDERKQADAARTQRLNRAGYRVLRFWNKRSHTQHPSRPSHHRPNPRRTRLATIKPTTSKTTQNTEAIHVTLPSTKRKGTRASEARSQGMPLSTRGTRVTRRSLPSTKRKGTRASEARSQGMHERPSFRRKPALQRTERPSREATARFPPLVGEMSKGQRGLTAQHHFPPLFASAKGGRGKRSETQGVHTSAWRTVIPNAIHVIPA